MHIDMNSYFASVEQQDTLAWRGQPVGVCEHLGGIIIAASVEAKKWGIKTGTPVWEARRLYPKIILTKTHPDRYRHYTAKFLKVFEDYTNDLDKYSIDEAFLDVTTICNITKNGVRQDPFVEAAVVAREIKQRMIGEVGDWLRCSVGIGTNKLIAKIASDMQKPDGLVVVRPEDKAMLYDKLQLTDIPGIGFRMERRLQQLGIKTLKDLRDYPKTKLIEQFGVPGYHLYNMGQLEGSWKEGFVDEPLKSIGHMYTVAKEYRKPGVLEPVLYKLSEMVGARLRVNDMSGDVLHVHVHTMVKPGDFLPENDEVKTVQEGFGRSYKNIECFGKSRRLGYQIQDGRDIFLEAMATLHLLQLDTTGASLYLVGVTVASLQRSTNQQSLFRFENRKRPIMAALDKVNDKYGDFTLARVPAFLARDIIRDSIGFGRMKEFKTSPVKRTFYGH